MVQRRLLALAALTLAVEAVPMIASAAAVAGHSSVRMSVERSKTPELLRSVPVGQPIGRLPVAVEKKSRL